MTFSEENNLLYNNFLEDYFYKNLRSSDRVDGLRLELIVSPKCNLGCKYCYIHKYGHETYADSLFDNESALKNLDKVLRWARKQEFRRIELDIFSGELFAQEVGFKMIEQIYDFYKDQPDEFRPWLITIPTNFTFLCSDELTNRIENVRSKLLDIGIKLGLSASFDGKYMENNRPFTHNLDIAFDVIRDDAYYDKVFEYIKKTNSGIHPMIYSEGIEKWIDNFNWFQEQMEKHGIPWQNIYLLQVRNDNWTPEQNEEFYKFIRYIIRYSFDKYDRNEKEYFNDFIMNNKKGFNILTQPFGHSSRGMPCGIQDSLPIRLGDMRSFPCHRLMYPDLEIGKFVDDEENVLRFEATRAELGLTIYGCESRNFPICADCIMNRLCVHGCLGSQYESTHDMFTPIPTVCANSYALLKAIVHGFKEIGIYNRMFNLLDSDSKNQLYYMEENGLV